MRAPRLSICPSFSHSAKTPHQLRYSSPQRTRRAHLLLRSKCASARLRRAPNRFPRKTICAPRNIRVSLSAFRGVSPSEKYQKAIKEALNKSRHAPCLHIFCLRNLHTRFNQHFLKSRRIAIISHLPRGFQSALPSPTPPKRRTGYDTAHHNARGARICSCGANALLRGFAAHQIVFRVKRFARRASRLTNPLSRAIITL